MPELAQVHVDSPNSPVSVESGGQLPAVDKVRRVDHTHAVAGGGSHSHSHELSADDRTHSHGPQTRDNPTDKELLPFANQAKLAEPSEGRNDPGLSNSDYAYVDSKGGKHLRIDDEGHVRAAMSRFNQTQFESAAAKSAAAKKVLAAAKKFGIAVSDDNPLTKLSERGPSSADGALIRLAAGQIDLAEGRVPLLRTGAWDFDNSYGELQVSRDDLQTIKRVYDERVRRQDWPVFFRGQVTNFGEANEDHFPARAVGWVKGLEFRDDDHLDALVDFNATGDRLVKDKAYQYSSAELVRNWKDAETGEVYPLVATGVALTNTPRIKDLGTLAIAASEAGDAEVLAFSEGPVSTRQPAEARRLLLADGDNDPDHDGDDDGPVPPCVFQPAYNPDPCPGYTRRPGDTDGDGVCLLADRGCNGYRAISQGVTPLPMYATAFSESGGTQSMSKEAAATATGAQSATAGAVSAGEEQPKQEQQAAANARENENILASERAQRAAAETEVAQLSERVRTLESAHKLAGVSDRLEKAVREGRITPAQRDTYMEHAVELSEERNQWFLSEIENRPAVIELKERGVAGDDTEMDESKRLDQAARALMSERAKESRPLKYRDALLEVSSVGYGRGR